MTKQKISSLKELLIIYIINALSGACILFSIQFLFNNKIFHSIIFFIVGIILALKGILYLSSDIIRRCKIIIDSYKNLILYERINFDDESDILN